MERTEQFKNEIYQTYQPKVFGYMISKVNNAELSEDLTADVFLKVYEKLDDFDETKASVSTWIYTIAKNRLTDYFRTRRVFEEVPETLNDGSDVEEEVCNREMLDKLAASLKKLPERERDIIILRYYSGFTLKEIAEKLRISYAYVKVLQNKALDALRRDFE